MADHNISVFIRGDATQLKATLSQAQGSLRNFSQAAQSASGGVGSFTGAAGGAASAVGAVGASATQAGGQIRTFASIAGMASAVIASFRAQNGVFSGIAAGAATLGKELLTVMPIVLGIRVAMRAVQEGTRFIVESFMNFDTAMANSTAIMGTLTDAMRGDLVQATKEVSENTTISADKAAEGLYFIASAGFDAKSSLEALPVAANFAQAGMMDMEKATEMLLDTTRAYGLVVQDAFGEIDGEATAKNMEMVSDVISKAAIDSNATVEQLAASLTNKAGGAARQLGKDIKETSAVLEGFASVGIKGASAGTQLSIVWRDLQTKSIKNREVFDAMGVQVFDMNGEMRNTADILLQLNGALKGMSDEGKKASLMQMGFTDRSIQAMLSIMDLGGEIKRYEAHLNTAAGMTQSIVDKQLTALSAKFEIVRNHAQNLVISLGTGLLNAITSLAQEAQPAFEGMVEVAQNLYDAVKPMAEVLAGLAAIAIWTPFKQFLTIAQPVIDFMKEHKTLVNDLLVFLTVRSVVASQAFANAMNKVGISALAAGRQTVSSSAQMQAALAAVTLSANTAATGATGAFNGMTLSQRLAAVQAGQTAAQVTNANRSMGTSAQIMAATTTMSIEEVIAAQNVLAVQSMKNQGILAKTGSGLKGFFGSVASAAGLAMIPLMNLTSKISEAGTKADEFVSKLGEKNDLSTFSGLDKDMHQMADAAKELHKSMPSGERPFGILPSDADWAGAVGGLKNMVGMQDDYVENSQKLDKLSQKALDDLKAQEQAFKSYNQVQGEMGGSTDLYARSVKDLGLQLNMSDEDFKKNKDAIVKNAAAIQTMMGNVAPAARDMAGESTEAFQEIADASEKLNKEFKKNLEGMIDPMTAYNQAMKNSVDFGDVWSNAEEADKKAAESQKDSIKSQTDEIDKAIEALQDQKKAQSDARADLGNDKGYTGKKGAKNKEALQDDGRAQNAAFDKQIQDLQDRKKRLDDEASDIKPPENLGGGDQALQKYMTSLKKQTATVRQFNDDIIKIQNDPRLKGIVSDAFIEDLRKLGPEKAGPIMTSILTNTEAFVTNWKDTLKQATVDDPMQDWVDNLKKRAQDAEDSQANAMKIIQAAPPGKGLNIVERIHAEMKEKAPEVLRQLADSIGTDNFNTVVDSFSKIPENYSAAADKTLNIVDKIRTGNQQDIDNILKTMNTAEIDKLITDSHLPQSYADTIRQHIQDILKGIQKDIEDTLRNSTLTLTQKIDEIRKKWEEAKTHMTTEQLEQSKGITTEGGVNNQGAGDKLGIGEVINRYYQQHPELDPNAPVDMNEIIRWAKEKKYMANGGILKFANGSEQHVAQIGRMGATRVWNEPETGGEAYIPLASSKRARSAGILAQVASSFGMSLNSMRGAPVSRHEASAPQIRIVPVPVPIATTNQTNFHGDIKGSNIGEIQADAMRKKRLSALNGGY